MISLEDFVNSDIKNSDLTLGYVEAFFDEGFTYVSCVHFDNYSLYDNYNVWGYIFSSEPLNFNSYNKSLLPSSCKCLLSRWKYQFGPHNPSAIINYGVSVYSPTQLDNIFVGLFHQTSGFYHSFDLYSDSSLVRLQNLDVSSFLPQYDFFFSVEDYAESKYIFAYVPEELYTNKWNFTVFGDFGFYSLKPSSSAYYTEYDIEHYHVVVFSPVFHIQPFTIQSGTWLFDFDTDSEQSFTLDPPVTIGNFFDSSQEPYTSTFYYEFYSSDRQKYYNLKSVGSAILYVSDDGWHSFSPSNPDFFNDDLGLTYALVPLSIQEHFPIDIYNEFIYQLTLSFDVVVAGVNPTQWAILKPDVNYPVFSDSDDPSLIDEIFSGFVDTLLWFLADGHVAYAPDEITYSSFSNVNIFYSSSYYSKKLLLSLSFEHDDLINFENDLISEDGILMGLWSNLSYYLNPITSAVLSLNSGVSNISSILDKIYDYLNTLDFSLDDLEFPISPFVQRIKDFYLGFFEYVDENNLLEKLDFSIEYIDFSNCYLDYYDDYSDLIPLNEFPLLESSEQED